MVERKLEGWWVGCRVRQRERIGYIGPLRKDGASGTSHNCFPCMVVVSTAPMWFLDMWN